MRVYSVGMKKVYGEIAQCWECGKIDWVAFKYGETESYKFEDEITEEIVKKYETYSDRFEIGQEVKVRYNKTIYIFTVIKGQKCDRCDPKF